MKNTPHYAGAEFADLMMHDGGLRHVVGASCYQVTRANRAHPELADGAGNTYNHGPDLTYWRGHFYLQYLSNPVDEHIGAGQSFLVKSKDGMHWDPPQVSFPVVTVPAGEYHCGDGTVITVPEEKPAFMHQRMAFFHASDDRLLVTGFYGHAPHHDICPWQHYGMGRAVREIHEDGTLGPPHFIRYLDFSGWTEDRLPFPYYKRSSNPAFVAACDELMASPLVTQQWREEHGWPDDKIGIKMPQVWHGTEGVAANSPFEAASSFCHYSINSQTKIALWKQGNVGRSDDGGKTFSIQYEPSFATAGAKSWGQKTEDGNFAIAYVNSLSSEHRYPLVAVSSQDGIKFDNMAVICGEVPPRRYDGIYKDHGPQYIRGIAEGHAAYPANAFWLCYSMNKEDIYVSRVPVPMTREVADHIHDDFSNCEDGYIPNWNIYSPRWAPVRIHNINGKPCLRLADRDPCDYARAMRVFPKSESVTISLDFMSAAQYPQNLEFEVTNSRGTVAARVFAGDGWLRVRYGSNACDAFLLPPHARWHTLALQIDCANNEYKVFLNGNEFEHDGAPRLVNKVNDVERLVIRTKPRRYLPNYEIYPESPDMQGVDSPTTERAYYITNVSTH